MKPDKKSNKYSLKKNIEYYLKVRKEVLPSSRPFKDKNKEKRNDWRREIAFSYI